jgi:DNA-directed RNA polymerase subunit L
MYKVTAIVKKCRKEDAKPGRNWCVYKHDHPLNDQPKGWPKTYSTKEKANHGLKMMKTFGGNMTFKITAKEKKLILKRRVQGAKTPKPPKFDKRFLMILKNVWSTIQKDRELSDSLENKLESIASKLEKWGTKFDFPEVYTDYNVSAHDCSLELEFNDDQGKELFAIFFEWDGNGKGLGSISVSCINMPTKTFKCTAAKPKVGIADKAFAYLMKAMSKYNK